MIVGGGSEASSECKSVTNTGRNSLSQDDKRIELKGKRQTGNSANNDKKNEASEASKLTYTSEEDVYYESGGRQTNIHRSKLVQMSKRRSISRRYELFVLQNNYP